MQPPTDINTSRLNWDLTHAPSHARYDQYWRKKNFQLIPSECLNHDKDIWIEIGAGTGAFFAALARLHPEKFLIAIERFRLRAQRLVKKTKKAGLENLVGLRGNAIPAIICGIPDNRLERIYILYPCPFPKMSQRMSRWYLHPLMPHLIRTLKPGGLLIWTSDQKFYIDEARFVCEERLGLEVIKYGEVTAHPLNHLDKFPGGRTKFEQSFWSAGLPSYELIVRKRPFFEPSKV